MVKKKKTPLRILFISLLFTSCMQTVEESKNEKTSQYVKASKIESEIEKESPILIIDSTSSENKQLFESFRDYPYYKEGEYKKAGIVNVPVGQSSMTFVDAPNTKFDYLGTLQITGFHIVSARSLKHAETYLIDVISGHIDTIWGDNPTMHIGDEYLVAKSMDYNLSKSSNGFQIWKMSRKRKWSKIKEFNQQNWIPLEFKWSNTTPPVLIVKRTSIDNYNREKPSIKTNIEYVKYSFK